MKLNKTIHRFVYFTYYLLRIIHKNVIKWQIYNWKSKHFIPLNNFLDSNETVGIIIPVVNRNLRSETKNQLVEKCQ